MLSLGSKLEFVQLSMACAMNCREGTRKPILNLPPLSVAMHGKCQNVHENLFEERSEIKIKFYSCTAERKRQMEEISHCSSIFSYMSVSPHYLMYYVAVLFSSNWLK